MKAKRVVLGPSRAKYAATPERDPLGTARVAGGGIFETDPIERIDAASRREERHRSFEEKREMVALVVPESGGSVRRAIRKIRRVLRFVNRGEAK